MNMPGNCGRGKSWSRSHQPVSLNSSHIFFHIQIMMIWTSYNQHRKWKAPGTHSQRYDPSCDQEAVPSSSTPATLPSSGCPVRGEEMGRRKTKILFDLLVPFWRWGQKCPGSYLPPHLPRDLKYPSQEIKTAFFLQLVFSNLMPDMNSEKKCML